MNSTQRILRVATLSLLVLVATAVSAQFKTAKLPNGFTYYLYSDPSFNKEVNFYLYQNVGAILEEKQQQGLAHYLEHLAFNATEHYPQGVMNFLRQRGLQAFHAQTGLNDTRYSVGNIPTSDQGLVDSLFLVLKDWCNGITFNKAVVEKERGIILEEKRQRNTIDKRLSDAIAPTIYNASPYAFRNIIGHEKALKSYKAEDIARFYRQWYRPDLQCLIIVGDFDLDAYRQKVERTFASLTLPSKAAARPFTSIESHAKPLYYSFVDAENRSNSFGLYQRIAYEKAPIERNLTEDLIQTMIFNELMPQRIARLHNSNREAFIAATVSFSELVRGYAQIAWDVVPYQGQEQEALRQILRLRQEARTVGFSEAEFTDAQEKIIQNLKELLESDNTLGTANNFVESFRQNYLYGLPIKNFKDELTHNLEFLVELEVRDFNAWVKRMMGKDDNLSFITYTSKAKTFAFRPNSFEQTLSEVIAHPITEAPTEVRTIERLVDFEVKPGRILESHPIADLEAHDWHLSNGARVIYKHLPALKGRFYFVGTSPRGRKVVSAETYPSYVAMRALAMKSGVHHYNRNDLYQWLRGKNLDLNLTMNEKVDGIGGNAAVEQADNFFDYLYLVLNHQRFDEVVFSKYVQKQKYLWETREQTPIALAQDSVQMLLYPITPNNPRKDADFYDAMQYDRLASLFRQHLANPSSFTYCLVGDIDEARARQLVEQRIASLPALPSTPEVEISLDFSNPAPSIVRTFTVLDNDDKADVSLEYRLEGMLSERERKALPLLEGLLQNRLFEELRERQNATYGVDVQVKQLYSPTTYATLGIHFVTQSTKAIQMKALTQQILQDLQTGSIGTDEFKRVKIPFVLEEQKVKAQQNAEIHEGNAIEDDNINPLMWLALLENYVTPNTELTTQSQVSIEELQVSDVQNLAQKLVQKGHLRDIMIVAKPKPVGLHN